MAEREVVIKNKKDSIKKINALLESYINSGKEQLVDKANKISYWLKTYVDYISSEDRFDSTRLISYSRGNVIRVNFGFNVGKELGGLHFAVVLDNDNKQSADVLTVIPLSSTDGKKIHSRSVDLGKELYEKVNANQTALLKTALDELEDIKRAQKAVEAVDNVLEMANLGESENNEEGQHEAVQTIQNYQREIDEKFKELEQNLDRIKRNDAEISKMKSGSMAVVNQITTVSKQRIFTPKKSEDFLYGITLSTSAMEKINERVKGLYCR